MVRPYPPSHDEPPPEKPPAHSVVHARSDERERALCGAAPGVGGWTKRRKFVTCDRCHAEIGRRLMTPGTFDPKTGKRLRS